MASQTGIRTRALILGRWAVEGGRLCAGVVAWSKRHQTWTGWVFLVALVLSVLSGWAVAAYVVAAGWALPALVVIVWARVNGHSFERWVGGPWRRYVWRSTMATDWPALCRSCGLSVSRKKRTTKAVVTVWTHPRLVSVNTSGWTMTLTVRARAGQTSGDLCKAAGAVAAAVGADSFTAHPVTPSTAAIELVMADHLAGTVHAPTPSSGDRSAMVTVGRSANAGLVALDPLAGLHMAFQGATRSGKSVLCYLYLSALAHRKDVLVCGIDPTGILLNSFTPGRGGAWVCTSAKDGERIVAVLDAITDRMDQRITDLVDGGKDKIAAYNECTPAILVVFEEYPGLLSQLAKDDEAHGRKGKDRVGPQVERAVGRFIKEGAKVGVTVLILAQRMSAKAIETDDRSNIPVRVTLRVDNGDAVRMLHDGVNDTGVELVRQFPPGRGLIEAPGMPLQKFQADLIDYDTYKARVAAGIASTDSVIAFRPFLPPAMSVVEDETGDGSGDALGKAA